MPPDKLWFCGILQPGHGPWWPQAEGSVPQWQSRKEVRGVPATGLILRPESQQPWWHQDKQQQASLLPSPSRPRAQAFGLPPPLVPPTDLPLPPRALPLAAHRETSRVLGHTAPLAWGRMAPWDLRSQECAPQPYLWLASLRPAVLWLQASRPPTCTLRLTCRPQEDL